jgi:hypothetical protein
MHNSFKGIMTFTCTNFHLHAAGPAVLEAGLATHWVPHNFLDSIQSALQALGPSRASDFAEVSRTLDAVQASAGPRPCGMCCSISFDSRAR